ncbi:MAG: hypothetical protein V4561_06665 [Bacteroidota bacterium]
MEHTLPSEVNECIKADIRTLIIFAERIRDLEQDNTSSSSDLLRTILATYGIVKLVIFDNQVVISSDKIVHDFIHKFIDSIEEHISILQDKYGESLSVNTQNPD